MMRHLNCVLGCRFVRQQSSEVQRMRSGAPPLPPPLPQLHTRGPALALRAPDIFPFLSIFIIIVFFFLLLLERTVNSLRLTGVWPFCFTLLHPSTPDRFLLICCWSRLVFIQSAPARDTIHQSRKTPANTSDLKGMDLVPGASEWGAARLTFVSVSLHWCIVGHQRPAELLRSLSGEHSELWDTLTTNKC